MRWGEKMIERNGEEELRKKKSWNGRRDERRKGGRGE